jgi:uncharacterized membrane protein YdbT with pleckstrin-like domain
MKDYIEFLQAWAPIVAIFLIVYAIFLITLFILLFLMVKYFGTQDECDYEEELEIRYNR